MAKVRRGEKSVYGNLFGKPSRDEYCLIYGGDRQHPQGCDGLVWGFANAKAAAKRYVVKKGGRYSAFIKPLGRKGPTHECRMIGKKVVCSTAKMRRKR